MPPLVPDSGASRSAPTPEIVQEPRPPASAALYTQRVSVPFEYPVIFTEHSLSPANTDLAWALCHREPQREQRAFVVVDAGLALARPGLQCEIADYFAAHSAWLRLVESPLSIPGGEPCKNDPRIVQRLHEHFQQAHLDRHSFVVALGGGAVLDAVGYAAATTHRGIRLVRLPTTVLAQNDSGVGVKNGVNAFNTKNFLGTFAPPWAVVNDFAFLNTLAQRDRIAGMAEAVKVALIRDAEFFNWLEAQARELREFSPQSVQHMVRRTAELHLTHIASGGDPFESGNTRPLDYGHWAAHKLEAMTEYELRHGEAVAIGLALDSLYSAAIGLLPHASARRVCALLRELGFQLHHPALTHEASGRLLVLNGLDEFREHLGGELTLTLLRGIGQATDAHDINEAALLSSISELAALSGE